MNKNTRNKDLDVNQIDIKMPEKKEDPIMCALILAIFKMPFMHRLTQSMAENTYVRSKGQNIIKTKIDKNTSNTLEQQMQRLRMKQLIYLCKVLNTPIHSSFPERKRTETEWNAFIRAAMPSISMSEDLEVSVDYETLLIAQGSLEVIEEVSITQDAEANTLTVTYPASDYGYGSEPTDTVQLVLLEKEKMRSRMFQVGTRGEDCTETIQVPSGWTVENISAYVFMLSANGRKASNSIFVPIN